MIARHICECYRDLIAQGFKPSTPIVEHFWYLNDTILCCTLELVLMLEISRFNPQGVPLEMIFGNIENNVILSPLLYAAMNEGYVILNKGFCLSAKQNFITYDLLVSWNVSGGDGDSKYLALTLVK